MDDVIHHFKRPAAELWKFCGSSGRQWQRAAHTLTYLREHAFLGLDSGIVGAVRNIRIAGRTGQSGHCPTADLTERTVETDAASVMTKLDLYNDGHEHRRVLAVRTWLGIRRGPDPVSGTKV